MRTTLSNFRARWAKRWVNLRKSFCNFYRLRRAKLITMLENLGMDFEGHQHSGLDDTRNIARISMRMLFDGAELRYNEELFHDKRERNRTHAVICPLRRNDLRDSDTDESPDESPSPAGEENIERLTPAPVPELSGPPEKWDGEICGACNLKIERRPGENCVESLSRDLQGVTLNGSMTIDRCRCHEQQTENFDDLLTYYSLQKA